MEKIIEAYKKHAEQHGFALNPDKQAVEKVIRGLLENERKYGQRYCPCRRVSGNLIEDKPKICPCAWHLKEIKEKGQCYCGLFYEKNKK